MGIIISALGTLFTFITTFFLQYFTKKVAIGLTAVSMFMGFTVYFIGVLKALILTITVAMPSPIITAMSWFIPSNFTDCIAAIFAAYSARWVYDLKVKAMKISVFNQM